MKRINAATDVAQIGIWDPSRTAPELGKAKFGEYREELQRRAKEGQLFFVDTGGDGEFPVDVFIDEEVPQTLRKWMKRTEGRFKVECAGDAMRVGGLEDFLNDTEVITTTNDEIVLAPGTYALTLFQSQLSEDSDETEEEIIARVGKDEFDHYASKGTGLGVGCSCVVVAAVLPFFVHWAWSLALVAVGVAGFILRQALLRRDSRYHQVSQAITAFFDEVPAFVMHLRSTEDRNFEGGWFDASS